MHDKLLCWAAAAATALPLPCAAAGQKHKSAGAVQHIVIKTFQFQPSDVSVKAGTKVEWKNEDIVPHTVTADDGSFRSGKIEPGKTWTYTPTKPGSFGYTCTPHPNMHGKLNVQ